MKITFMKHPKMLEMNENRPKERNIHKCYSLKIDILY